MRLRLLADGGGTKIKWMVVSSDGAVLKSFQTSGINPFVASDADVARLIAREVAPNIVGLDISSVCYYGAGCRGHGSEAMTAALESVVGGEAVVIVDSDMLGACKSLFGDSQGVACILGTGANSALYDGHEIVGKVDALGYILGDEGSGAWLGKRLVAEVARGNLPAELCRRFFKRFETGIDEILRHVYRPDEGELPPNRFLAGFAPFLAENISDPAICHLVESGFGEFIRNSVLPYFKDSRFSCSSIDTQSLKVGFVGSIAYVFRDILTDVARKEGLCVNSVLKSPFDGLFWK